MLRSLEAWVQNCQRVSFGWSVCNADACLYPHSHLNVLHHHVNIRGCLDNLIQTDDVRVHEEAQDFDLSSHCNRVWSDKGWGQLTAVLIIQRVNVVDGTPLGNARTEKS